MKTMCLCWFGFHAESGTYQGSKIGPHYSVAYYEQCARCGEWSPLWAPKLLREGETFKLVTAGWEARTGVRTPPNPPTSHPW